MSSSPEAPARSGAAGGALERYGDAVVEDPVHRLATARLGVVDHERLLADFPQLRPRALLDANPGLRSLAPTDRPAVIRRIAEQWLLEAAAVVSTAQALPSDVNTPIQTRGGAPISAWRPGRYGRACIVAVGSVSVRVQGLRQPVQVPAGGELDLKGVGVHRDGQPVRGAYSSGLLSLPDALQEYLVERLLDSIFRHHRAGVRTLPHYGIVDTGFDGLTSAGSFPAAIAIRRAHVRDPDSDLPRWDTPDHGLTVRTELLLRRHGLTSSMRDAFVIRDDGGTLHAYCSGERTPDSPELIGCLVEFLSLELPWVADRINVQFDAPGGAELPQIVDFGHYSARASFDRPLVSMVCDRPMAWGGMLLPSDQEYAQPDPTLIPRGRAWQLACEPGARLFDAETARIASAFRRSEIDHSTVRARTATVIDEWVSGWPRDGAGSAEPSRRRDSKPRPPLYEQPLD